MEVSLTTDSDGGTYYSPAVDVTGYSKVSIILTATRNGTVDIEVSPDGQSWSDYGSMDLIQDRRASYKMPMGSNNFVRYSVTTTGTISTSYIFMGGYVNG